MIKRNKLIIGEALRVLAQKKVLVELLTDADFKRGLDGFFGSSVGGHIRHSCDHFQNVLLAHDYYCNQTLAETTTTPELTFSYDERSRATSVQSQRGEALKAIDAMVVKVPTLALDTRIVIGFLAAETEPMETFSIQSTVARELSFVAHHGIHHLATIRLMMDRMAYKLDATSNIGKAPSTVQFEGAATPSPKSPLWSGPEAE
jgi:hypothetical protein